MRHFTQEETDYMDYLEEIYDAPNYGLLYRKGDPNAFEIGMDEWLSQKRDDRLHRRSFSFPRKQQ